jgi:hypothetical protein
MKEMALAGTGRGEKASDFKSVGEGAIVTGDRAYCGKQGMERLSGAGGDFLFRFGTKRFHVYIRQGGEANILGVLQGGKAGRDRGEGVILRMRGGAQTAPFPRVAENERSGGERS